MKQNIIGGVLVLVALVAGALFGGAPVSDKLGGSVHELKEWYVNGIQVGGQNEQWVDTIEVGPGVDSDGWLNDTGRTVFVDMVTVSTTGTASSTFTIDVATSTTRTITSGSNPYSSAIDSAALATSTAAKTFNSIKDAGTNGISVIPVAAGQYLSVLLNSTGLEASTSTNRGFDLQYRVHYFYEGEN